MMERTKQDVQIDLLKEIHDICEENNLKYIMFGENAFNAFKHQTIKGAARITAVAMTRGDAERFCEIIERDYNTNRYVEGLFNNPRCNSMYISYGDRNTTDFLITRANYNKCRGVRIRIYYINARLMQDGTKIRLWTKWLSRERRLRKYLNTKVVSPKLWYIRAALKVANFCYNIVGGGKRYYKKIRKRGYIDTWEDIKNCQEVRIGQSAPIDIEYLYETDLYDVDNLKLNMPKNALDFFRIFYGDKVDEKEIRERKQKKKSIINTEIGYETVLSENAELIFEVRSCQEEILWERLKAKKERETVFQVWRLVKMTQKQVEYINYFAENIDRLLELDFEDEEQYEIIYQEVRPVISTLWRYHKYGMTFSIDEKTDALVEKVLLKRHNPIFVGKLHEIAAKQYFIK